MRKTGYRDLRLTDDACQYLKSRKQLRESFPDTVEQSLLDLSGTLSDEEAEDMCEAIREQEERSRECLDRLTKQMDS